MKALIFSHCSMNIEWLGVFSDPAKKILHSFFHCFCSLLLFALRVCIFVYFFIIFASPSVSVVFFFLSFSNMKKCETCTWFETITCLSASVKMISERTFHAGIQNEYFLLLLALLYVQNRQSVVSILLPLRLIFFGLLMNYYTHFDVYVCVCETVEDLKIKSFSV